MIDNKNKPLRVYVGAGRQERVDSMTQTVTIEETDLTVSNRDKPVRGRRPLFSQLVTVNGQPGMFIPLLQKEEREVIENWINEQDETPQPKTKSRKIAHVS